MDIEEMLQRAQAEQAKKVEKAEPPKSYYPAQCSGAMLREIIRLSHTHKDDADIKHLILCIKARKRIVGGNDRIRSVLDRLKK